MDIQKLNCLTSDNAATPKYNPYSGKSRVQVYYANNNKVITTSTGFLSQRWMISKLTVVYLTISTGLHLLYSAAFLEFLRAKHITPTNS